MKLLKILLFLFLPLFIWSGINPYSYLTWLLEVIPMVVGLFVLWWMLPHFRFSNWVYIWVFIAACLIVIGAHYTYSRVPLFNGIQELLGQSRNNYDKLGHWVQGVLPALMAKEYFVRKNIISQKSWINFIVISIAITVSVVYEFIEWLVAVVAKGDATDFLGAQGYIWDSQSDMLYAAIGGLCALYLMKGIHLKQINKLEMIEHDETTR